MWRGRELSPLPCCIALCPRSILRSIEFLDWRGQGAGIALGSGPLLLPLLLLFVVLQCFSISQFVCLLCDVQGLALGSRKL